MKLGTALRLGVARRSGHARFDGVRTLVGVTMELDDHRASVEEVLLERIQEATGLEVFRGRADGDSVVFDDVSDAVPVGGDGAKPKQPQCGVTAVAGRDDRVVEDAPSVVGEDGWELLRVRGRFDV